MVLLLCNTLSITPVTVLQLRLCYRALVRDRAQNKLNFIASDYQQVSRASSTQHQQGSPKERFLLPLLRKAHTRGALVVPAAFPVPCVKPAVAGP